MGRTGRTSMTEVRHMTTSAAIIVLLSTLAVATLPFASSRTVLSSAGLEEEEDIRLPTTAAREGWLRSEHEMRWMYEEWAVEHDKAYGGDLREKEKRFEIFKENLRLIDEHNRPENNHTYTLGLNKFADLTNEEFRALYLGPPINVSAEPAPPFSSEYDATAEDDLLQQPSHVDWRARGAVSGVKDQGQCLSCRAFAAVATIEGLNRIINGRLITLSEQELVDCDHRNNGCAAGYILRSYQYVVDNGGIDTDLHYPYRGVSGMCKSNRNRVVGISSYARVQPQENALRRAVAAQPVSVLIEAYGDCFRFYSGGVFRAPCGTKTDHFLTVIGYGTDTASNTPYWLVKNSWGVSWGERGFGKIQRNVGGLGKCGILSYIMHPVMQSYSSSPVNAGDAGSGGDGSGRSSSA